MSYKVNNVQDPNQYPEDYSWLNPQTKIKIESYMNGVQDLANRYNNSYMEDLLDDVQLAEDVETRYLRLYNHTITSLTGSKNAYATLGIMFEYDWPNHPKKWFLATKQDAIDYNEFQESETDDSIDNILTSNLLSYQDVGI